MGSGEPRAPREVILATRSVGKQRELRALCAEAGIVALDLDALGVAPDPAEGAIEAFDTFAENARAKAAWFAARLPGRVVLAEDSGLEVAALGGLPGVHSKRWSGAAATLAGHALDEANNAALARAMRGVEDRRARYACVAVLWRDGHVAMARGECTGRILVAPRGTGGFGYDPWFESDELGVTFAESRAEEKARVSHRGRAVRALLDRERARE